MLHAALAEHERGLGNWPAEWETLPEIALLAGGALAAMLEVVEALDVDERRMRANLEITRGLVFAEAVQTALAPAMGRDAAHSLVAGACGAPSSKSAGSTRAGALTAETRNAERASYYTAEATRYRDIASQQRQRSAAYARWTPPAGATKDWNATLKVSAVKMVAATCP